MRRSFLLLSFVFTAACGSGSSSGSSGTDATDATDAVDATDGSDTTDSADGTDTTDAADGNDAADATDGTSGEIPKCKFQHPLGAKCNPYPDCESGCPDGQMCSVSETTEGIKRVVCLERGDVPLGEACNHVEGPFCEEGLCIDAQCRAFCVDAICENGGSCQPYNGVPGKPTVCGAAQQSCDPAAPQSEPCSAETPCYLNSDESTDCKAGPGVGVQGDPCASSFDDCSAGFSCAQTKDGKICGKLCHAETCQEECGEGFNANQLSSKYSVCVPGTVAPPATPCNALAQDCAGEQQACYPTQEGFVCLTRGTAAPGAECASVNDCAKGAFCLNNGRCTLLCEVGDASNALCETGVEAKCVEVGGGVGYCDE